MGNASVAKKQKPLLSPLDKNKAAEAATLKTGIPSATETSSSQKNCEWCQLNDFKRLRTLGNGVHGTVVLAEDAKTGKRYALKMVEKSRVIEFNAVERKLEEMSILKSLNFPFVMEFYSSFKDNSYIYFVLGFVGGGEMFSLLREMKKFSLSIARGGGDVSEKIMHPGSSFTWIKFYAAEVLLALEYLHSLNIAYRNLKPETILIDEFGHLKLAAFGFAKRLPDGRTYTLCGTPDYLAPEVVTGSGHGKPVDMWALGILMFEMAASYPPFFDEDPMKTYTKIIHGKIAFPAGWDSSFVDLISKLLASRQSKRLGCGAGGASEVKAHEWFVGTDFCKILERKVDPPFVPKLERSKDGSNFEEYPETPFKISPTPQHVNEFEQF